MTDKGTNLKQYSITRSVEEIRTYLAEAGIPTEGWDNENVKKFAIGVKFGSGETKDDVLKFAKWLGGEA